MELLLSNIPPLCITKRKVTDCFMQLLANADAIKIATGYISADAMADLKQFIEVNKKPYLQLIIGMHGFEGFTHTQHEMATDLDKFLRNNNIGSVNVVTTFKFHGKIYSFSKKKTLLGCILGSSNLNSVFDSQNLYEADLFIDEPKLVKQLDSFIFDLSDKACTALSEHIPTFIEQKNLLLEDHDDVEKIAQQELSNILAQKTGLIFKIPTKASNRTQRSNLNAHFGLGRKNNKGIIKIRPWYEVELIVPSLILKQNGYPGRNVTITVYTDDGWKFQCHRSGDNGKNFRSAKDLKILGRWIKGRLENKGSLKMGTPVTEETLHHYGRDCIDLIATKDPLVWILDFNPLSSSYCEKIK